MKMRFYIVVLFCFVLLGLGCVPTFGNSDSDGSVNVDSGSGSDSGSNSDDGGTIGTTISLPKPPLSLTLFPDFEKQIPENALDSSESSTLPDPSSSTNNTITLTIPDIWEQIFNDGGIKEARVLREGLKIFGAAVEGAFESAGVTEFTADLKTVGLAAPMAFVDTSANWEIKARTEPADETYVRFFFRNSDTDQIQGTYLLKRNDDGDAVKGLLVYINPKLMSPDSIDDGHRLFALAFDFTDESNNLMITRLDKYHKVHNRFYTANIQEQCDRTTDTCIGEYAEIVTKSPERIVNEVMIPRFSWNNTTNEICMTLMKYKDGQSYLGTTYSFTGPEAPSEDEITKDACVLAAPHWVFNITTNEQFFQRYDDTDPLGGTALEILLDGRTKMGWEQTLTIDLIDSWLDGTGL